MDKDLRSVSPYWVWLGTHDLTLVLDRQGALWQFRRTGTGPGPALDAHLEDGALVVTLSSPGHDGEVGVVVGDRRVRFAGVCAGSAIACDVLLPRGLDLDEDGAKTARRDGSLEVRIPRPTTPATEQAVTLRTSAA